MSRSSLPSCLHRSMTARKLLSALLVVGVTFGALFAYLSERSFAATPDDVLVIGIAGDVDNLDPARDDDEPLLGGHVLRLRAARPLQSRKRRRLDRGGAGSGHRLDGQRRRARVDVYAAGRRPLCRRHAGGRPRRRLQLQSHARHRRRPGRRLPDAGCRRGAGRLHRALHAQRTVRAVSC